MSTQVEWPDRRLDVIEALQVLASDVPILSPDGRDTRWPDLTSAVHWLVDDTFWDQQNPSKSIGEILTSESEAHAVRLAVRSVVIVSETVGAESTDRDWFASAEWPRVQALARSALILMRSDAEWAAPERKTSRVVDPMGAPESACSVANPGSTWYGRSSAAPSAMSEPARSE